MNSQISCTIMQIGCIIAMVESDDGDKFFIAAMIFTATSFIIRAIENKKKTSDD